MNVTLLATCATCPGAVALKQSATNEGYVVNVESVKRPDERTIKSAELGIGLPVLVRDDGAMSDDGKTWVNEPKKKRTKVTHPVDEVIVDADTNYFE